MLTHKDVKLLLSRDHWIVSLDLMDGYCHIPLTPSKRPYLGFVFWNKEFRFKTLPFGLNITPRIFTKLISFVVSQLTLKGVTVMAYLDDLLIISESPNNV